MNCCIIPNRRCMVAGLSTGSIIAMAMDFSVWPRVYKYSPPPNIISKSTKLPPDVELTDKKNNEDNAKTHPSEAQNSDIPIENKESYSKNISQEDASSYKQNPENISRKNSSDDPKTVHNPSTEDLSGDSKIADNQSGESSLDNLKTTDNQSPEDLPESYSIENFADNLKVTIKQAPGLSINLEEQKNPENFADNQSTNYLSDDLKMADNQSVENLLDNLKTEDNLNVSGEYISKSLPADELSAEKNENETDASEKIPTEELRKQENLLTECSPHPEGQSLKTLLESPKLIE